MSFEGYQDRALFYALSPSWFVSSKAVNSAVTPPNLAGMDGNRTHPRRLSRAPCLYPAFRPDQAAPD